MTAAHRRDRLRGLLEQHDLDALLVTSLINVRYLTGFTGSAGELLVSRDPHGDMFVTDGRYDEQSARECPDVRRLVVPPSGWLRDAVPAGRLGVEAHVIPWERVRRLSDTVAAEVTPADRLVEQLRTVKDDTEVAALRRACSVADAAFADLVTWLAPGMTEVEAARRLDRAMADLGAQAPSFPTILAGGPSSAVPHHQPTGRRLESGDLVKIDFGALVDGYHSDMTRMLAFGPPPARLAKIFAMVRAAQAAGVAAVRAGAETAAIDATCRDALEVAGYGDRFVHGTGHGVGLEVHEEPFLRPAAGTGRVVTSPSVTLRAGMTVTVEPGVYLPGVGGVRIEDTLVVTPEGADVLTRTPKDLVVL